MVHVFALNFNQASIHLTKSLMHWLKFMKDKGATPLLLSLPEETYLTFAHKVFFAKEFETYQKNQSAYYSRQFLPMPVLHVLSEQSDPIHIQGKSNYVILDVMDPVTAVQSWNNSWQPDYWVCTNTYDYSLLRLQGISNVLCTPLLRHGVMEHKQATQGWLKRNLTIWIEGLISPGQEIFLNKILLRLEKIIPNITLCFPNGSLPIKWQPKSNTQIQYIPSSEFNLVGECHVVLYLPSQGVRDYQISPLYALSQHVSIILPASGDNIDFAGPHCCSYEGKELIEAETEVLQWLLRFHGWLGKKPYRKEIKQFISDSQPDSSFSQLENLIDGWHPSNTLLEKWLLSAGVQAQQANDLSLALAIYQQLIKNNTSQKIAAYINSANVLSEIGQYKQACEQFEQLLEISPNHIGGLIGLGNTYRRMGLAKLATPILEQAIQQEDKATNHWNLAFNYLYLGAYEKAWPHFEYRHEALKLRQVHPDRAQRWSYLQHKTGSLLILDEQGIGDTLQFLRFIYFLYKTTDLKICFAGKAATLPVIKKILPEEQVFDWDKTQTFSTFDYWVPLMSLPMALGIKHVEQIPPPSPVPETWQSEALHNKWQNTINSDRKLTVALCWRGNPDFKADKTRSPGLAPMLPLLEMKDIHYVSLQINELAIEEILSAGIEDKVQDVGSLIKSKNGSLLDTFHLLQQCDYVVTSCTSMAHMAGILGIPTFVLLPQNSDWRWLSERSDSPWYPSITLIRQNVIGSWEPSIETVQEALGHALLNQTSKQSNV